MSTAAAKSKRLFIPMTKYDAEKGIAYGVMASSTLDRANEIFDYEGSKPYVEKWSAAAVKATAGKSVGNLRSMHGQVAAGKLESINFNDDAELIEVAAKVVDPVEKTKCEEGVYTGFSLGGRYIKKWKDGDATRYIADPYEISLVDLPCIPDATFEYVKGAQSEVRKFHVPVEALAAGSEIAEPKNDDVVVKAQELAKTAGNPESWADHFAAARTELMKAAPADLEPKHVLEIATTSVDEPAAKVAGEDQDGFENPWTHPRLPGKVFAKKADCRIALAQLDADEAAAKLAAPVTDALKGLTAALDEKDPAGVKKNASDNPDDGKPDPKAAKPDPKAKAAADAKQKAKDEADKSKPMKSAGDVIARAKAYLAEKVPSLVERRAILKAAGEIDAVAALPAGFIEQPEEEIAKLATPELKKMASLYQVSSLISLVAQLESFHSCLTGAGGGSYYYGDGDRVTTVDASPELMTKISDMCDQLGAAASELLDEVLAAMKGDGAEKALGRGTVLADLHKIGARNSKADQNRLAKAHDLLAEIDPSMCTADKHAEGDLEKVLKAQEAAFTKTLGDIGDVIKDVAERVKRIEAQPVAGRPTHVNIVEKGSVLDSVINGSETHDANHAAFAEMAAERFRLEAPRRA